MNQHISIRVGDFIQTFTGLHFYPLDPRHEDICIEDIAHSLSLQCRYGGHCAVHYSVAQHSVLVSKALPDELKLWGLLHDAAEAYLVDVPRPVKRYLTGYRELEESILSTILRKYGLTAKEMPAEVKRVDDAILQDEANHILNVPARDWTFPEPALGIEINPWPAWFAKHQFLTAFEKLTN
jgi:hypothetical protein